MNHSKSLRYLPAALLALVIAVSFALAEPKGKNVTTKGELVDMWCYFEGGDHGADHKACSTACAKAGNPIGLLQSDGQVYVLAGMQDHQPAKDMLVDHMNDNVTVKGTLVSKGGINMLYVSEVTPEK